MPPNVNRLMVWACLLAPACAANTWAAKLSELLTASAALACLADLAVSRRLLIYLCVVLRLLSQEVMAGDYRLAPRFITRSEPTSPLCSWV
jgi:hypothetical protein